MCRLLHRLCMGHLRCDCRTFFFLNPTMISNVDWCTETCYFKVANCQIIKHLISLHSFGAPLILHCPCQGLIQHAVMLIKMAFYTRNLQCAELLLKIKKGKFLYYLETLQILYMVYFAYKLPMQDAAAGYLLAMVKIQTITYHSAQK